MALPVVVNVQRKQEDTYAERFRFDTDVTGATFAINVEGLGALTGSIVSAASTGSIVAFVVESAVANGSAGDYDYDVVMTSSGTTRTLVEGRWTITARTAS
jgi:hypothetical protein